MVDSSGSSARPTPSSSLPSPQALRMRPHICILGGGFGGLYTAVYAQKYRALRGDRCRITLVEPRSRFVFSPLLYELLSDEFAPWQVIPSYDVILKETAVERRQDSARDIDLKHRQVTLASGDTLHYDYLVVALGSQPRMPPIPGLREHAFNFRSFEDAQGIQQRLNAVRSCGRNFNESPISVAIIGAGPSGVELACKIGDLLGDTGRIVLIERGSELLKPFTSAARRVAYKALNKRRVELLFECSAADIQADRIRIDTASGDRWMDTDLVLWTAGAAPMDWPGTDPVPQNDRRQCRIRPTLQLPGHPEVLVLGDMADGRDHKNNPTPNTAQVAYQSADRAAANLNALLTRQSLKPFHYSHLGDMLTLGVGDALVDSSMGFTLDGSLAALARRVVYTYRLPTWHHRLKVARYELGRWLRRQFGGTLKERDRRHSLPPSC